MHSEGSLEVLKALAHLSSYTLIFTATSAQKTIALVECFNNRDKESTISLFEGFSIEEFEIFRQRVPVYSGLDADADAVKKLERLTGFLPGLLSLPRGTDFSLSLTPPPVIQPSDDRWITPLQRAVGEFVATCVTNIQDKHSPSHETAVFGTEYAGDPSTINFDIVSIPDDDGVVPVAAQLGAPRDVAAGKQAFRAEAIALAGTPKNAATITTGRNSKSNRMFHGWDTHLIDFDLLYLECVCRKETSLVFHYVHPVGHSEAPARGKMVLGSPAPAMPTRWRYTCSCLLVRVGC